MKNSGNAEGKAISKRIDKKTSKKINRLIEENIEMTAPSLQKLIEEVLHVKLSRNAVEQRKTKIKRRLRKEILKQDENVQKAIQKIPSPQLKELLHEHVAILPIPEEIIDELKKTQTYTIRNMLEIIQKLRIRFELSDISDKQLLRTSEVLANINEKLFSMIQKLIDDAESSKGSGDKIVINLYNEIINHVASDMKDQIEKDHIDIEVEEE